MRASGIAFQLHLYSGEVSEIYEYIPLECLPKDFGGELDCLETLHGMMMKTNNLYINLPENKFLEVYSKNVLPLMNIYLSIKIDRSSVIVRYFKKFTYITFILGNSINNERSYILCVFY